MSSTGIKRVVRPLKSLRAQPDSPHGHNLELNLSQEVQAMAYRSSGTTRSWCWGHPGPATLKTTVHAAPIAEITAVDTWTAFTIGNENTAHWGHDFGMPWRYTESFHRIRCYVDILTNVQGAFSWRVVTDAITGLIDVTNGEPSYLISGSYVPKMVEWKKLNWTYPHSWTRRVGHVWVTTPDVANALRRMLLVPQIRVEDIGMPIIDVGGTIRVRMNFLAFMDVPDQDQGFW